MCLQTTDECFLTKCVENIFIIVWSISMYSYSNFLFYPCYYMYVRLTDDDCLDKKK